MEITNKRIDYLSVSDLALSELKDRVAQKNSDGGAVLGIKIAVKTRGCSGLAYKIEYASSENITEFDELAEMDGAMVFIDPKASLFIFGTEMDFEEKKSPEGIVIESGFVFKNPNEKGRCGCGESFFV